MNLFSRAPMIGHHPVHGVWAEGDHGASRPYLDTFALAVSSYGFLVRRGERLTGSQWMRRIRSTYSQQEPRNRAVLDSVETVMQVRQYADDHVLLGPNGQPAFRGRLAHCQVHARALAALDERWADAPIRLATDLDLPLCDEADAAMINLRLVGAKLVRGDSARRFDADPNGFTLYSRHMFQGSVAPQYQLMVMHGKPAGLWHAEINALTLSAGEEHAARGETLAVADPAGEVGLDAELQLTTDLVRFAGYSGVVTYGSSVPGWKPQPGEGSIPADPDLSLEQVRESLGRFVASLVRHGWEPTAEAPLLLVRPAPLVNPRATVLPHERAIHPRLIGWKIPDGLVEHLFEQARERRAERQRG